MTTSIITVLVEGSVCRAAGGRYLARSVNAAVGGSQGSERAYPDKPDFLLPWKWNIGWKELSSNSISPATPIEAWRTKLEEWVKDRLEPTERPPKKELHSLWPTDLGKLPPETNAPDDKDPAWTDEQSWVMLQMQLARMDGRISHGLKLSNVVECSDVTPLDPVLLAITSIEVDGRTFDQPVDLSALQPPLNAADTQGEFLGDGGADIVFNVITDSDVEDIEALSMVSPIDWETRRVDFDKTDTSDGDWLADAEEKIEALCDPVLVLLTKGAKAEDASQSLTINSDALPNGLKPMLLASPDVLLLPLLAADDTPDDAQVQEWAKATEWLAELKNSGTLDRAFDALKSRLAGDFAERKTREDLRRLWMPNQSEGAENFSSYLLEAIIAAGTAAGISDGVLTWLSRDEASEVLMGRLLPAAVSLGVLRSIAVAAAGEVKDRELFRSTLKSSFSDELGKLLQQPDGTPLNTELSTEILTEVFRRNDGAGDLGTRDGLTVPVEAIFVQPGDFDPHEVLDGCLIAIRQTNHPKPEEGVWKVVTRGSATCLTEPSGDPLLVPNPPAIEQGAYNEEPDTSAGAPVYKTERRHALVSYHGLSLLPYAAEAEENPVLTYGSVSHPELPSLAFGGEYLVAVGYQSLGGLLPDGFCAVGKPLDFELTNLEESPTRLLPFMRTMLPGAPDLRMEPPAIGKEAPPMARAWQAEEDGVRPLWKEVAGAGDRLFETARKQARTKFLAHANDEAAVGDSLTFYATPPNLPTAPASDRPGADAVLRYWRARDKQWEASGSPWPDDGKAKWVPDPAVVGLRASGDGILVESDGGIRLRVYDPAKPSAPVHRQDIKLSPTEFLTFEISEGAFVVTVDGAKVALKCPQGESRVLVLSTLVDEHFLEGGTDQRFADDLMKLAGHEGEAGSIAIAVEVLPEREHLPDEKQLWQAITAWRKEDNGLILALDANFANPDPTKPQADEPFKFVSDIVCEWQEWRWDGGPVRDEELPGGNDDLALEDGSDESFVNFEAAYFTNRGSQGASSSTGLQLRSPPGDKPLPLLTRPGSANMGATYYRARLAVTSRYASLVSALPTKPDDPDARRWRGVMLAPKRIDPLPTPQISALIPLGGRVKHESDPDEVQAGAFALVLDTPWYDTRVGAGLMARLECEVIWEEDGDPSLPAAAISEMVNFFGKEGEDNGRKPLHNLDIVNEDAPRSINDVGVIGLTRDRGSAVAIYTGSLAFFDALIESPAKADGSTERQPIPADYTARLRCRAVLTVADETLTSDWSQALLIEFEPTIQSGTISAVFNVAAGTITLTSTSDSAGLMDRWLHILKDEGRDTRMMRQGLSAMLFRATTNYIGETILRVIGASDVVADDAANRLTLVAKGVEQPTHVRIFETVRHGAEPIDSKTGMGQLQELASQLLPEGTSSPHEPGQALMRVGPLIELDID